MLTVKKLKKYNVPKYPSGNYYDFKRNFFEKSLINGASSLFLMAALLGAGCGDGNNSTAGLPVYNPVPESEAEVVIVKVLNKNGINVSYDHDYDLVLDSGKIVKLNLDGFDEVKKVGYEYSGHGNNGTDYIGADYSESNEIIEELKELAEDQGPYVKVFPEPIDKYTGWEELLEALMQEFIDDLKSKGVI